jgi:hypothetical protein
MVWSSPSSNSTTDVYRQSSADRSTGTHFVLSPLDGRWPHIELKRQDVVMKQEIAMTPFQARAFKAYVRFQEQPMSVRSLLRANAKAHGIMFLLFVPLGLLAYAVTGWVLPAFVGTAFFVALARDIGHYRRTVLIWPALRQVLDWNEMEAMIAEFESCRA